MCLMRSALCSFAVRPTRSRRFADGRRRRWLRLGPGLARQLGFMSLSGCIDALVEVSQLLVQPAHRSLAANEP
jgi:hypothetical protein